MKQPRGGNHTAPVGDGQDNDSHGRKHHVPSAGVVTGLSAASGISESNKALGLDNSGRGQTPMRKPKTNISTDRGKFCHR